MFLKELHYTVESIAPCDWTHYTMLLKALYNTVKISVQCCLLSNAMPLKALYNAVKILWNILSGGMKYTDQSMSLHGQLSSDILLWHHIQTGEGVVIRCCVSAAQHVHNCTENFRTASYIMYIAVRTSCDEITYAV
jgi:hypothetical protein